MALSWILFPGTLYVFFLSFIGSDLKEAGNSSGVVIDGSGAVKEYLNIIALDV